MKFPSNWSYTISNVTSSESKSNYLDPDSYIDRVNIGGIIDIIMTKENEYKVVLDSRMFLISIDDKGKIKVKEV